MIDFIRHMLYINKAGWVPLYFKTGFQTLYMPENLSFTDSEMDSGRPKLENRIEKVCVYKPVEICLSYLSAESGNWGRGVYRQDGR